MQALLRRVVHMVEGEGIDDLPHAQLLDFVVSVELEADASEAVLNRVLVVKSLTCHLLL